MSNISHEVKLAPPCHHKMRFKGRKLENGIYSVLRISTGRRLYIKITYQI